MKLDALFIASHPDDIEITSAGTAIKLVNDGKKVGIVDLTQGELSTRGNIKTRRTETANASKVMGIHYRTNLKLKDGNIQNTHANRLKLIKVLRETKPGIIFAPYPSDRHSDHVNASNFIRESAFLSGLQKIKTGNLEAYRPHKVFYYRHAYDFPISFIVDISDTYAKKMEAISCYASQFFKTKNISADEPETYISSKLFWKDLDTRARFFGFKIGVEFGEPFFCFEDLNIQATNLLKI
ncbi:MAG: bacillithiol biosynthesis deacetylase BshB1 [Ignavibacteria bacterium]|nr:bacillithiol biosynthesis deacetylase BshB1 [Ignavibacteria bacterium]